MAIGLAAAALGLTGCEPVPGNMSSEPPTIVGVWDVYQYRVSITGSPVVDLARESDVTATFNETPQSFSFRYHPPLQGIGLAAELAEEDGTYVQNESRKKLTLTGRKLSGAHGAPTYDYTLTSHSLRLHFTRSFFRTINGSTQSGTETVTMMARRK